MSKLARAERIDLRISSELKRLIEQAAALSGVSVSSFITETAVRRSREVIQEAQTIILSNRDRDIFLAMLEDEAGQPNAAMREAARRHRQMSV